SGGGTFHNGDTVSIVSNLNANQISAGNPTAGTAASFSGDVSTQLTDATTGMLDGENMIVCEVFFDYQPVLATMLNATTGITTTEKGFALAERTLIRRTLFHPRNGDLNSPPT